MKEFKVYCDSNECHDVIKTIIELNPSAVNTSPEHYDPRYKGVWMSSDDHLTVFVRNSHVDKSLAIPTLTIEEINIMLQSKTNPEIDNTSHQFEHLTVNDLIREQVIEKNVPGLNPERLLQTAAETIGNRAAIRDTDTERSMARTVNIFNAMTGLTLTERQGWEFMISLKLARGQQGGFNDDDYIDLAGYTALLAEHLCSLG